MHNNAPQLYDIGAEPAFAVVFVHGRGRDPQEMRELAIRLGVEGVHFVLPAADERSWYPQGFLAPLDHNEPQLSAAIAHYHGIVEGLIAQGFAPGKIFLGGFSQGACLTAEYLSRHPRRFAGAILFTGGLIGPPGTEWTVQPALAGMPVYLTTSRNDAWVPPGRVIETSEWLTRCGAPPETAIFESRDHIVSEEELGKARALVQAVMADNPPDLKAASSGAEVR